MHSKPKPKTKFNPLNFPLLLNTVAPRPTGRGRSRVALPHHSLIQWQWGRAHDASAPLKAKIRVGWATRDITPDRPVNLSGQMHPRISTGVATPL